MIRAWSRVFLIAMLSLLLFIVNTRVVLSSFPESKSSWQKALVERARYFLADLLWVRMNHLVKAGEAIGTPFEKNKILPVLARGITLLNPKDVHAYTLAIEQLWLRLRRPEMAYPLILEGLRNNPKSPELYLVLGNYNYYVKQNYPESFSRYHQAFRLFDQFAGMELVLAGEKNCLLHLHDPALAFSFARDENYLKKVKGRSTASHLSADLSTLSFSNGYQSTKTGAWAIAFMEQKSGHVRKWILDESNRGFVFQTWFTQDGLPYAFYQSAGSWHRFHFPHFDAFRGTTTDEFKPRRAFEFKTGTYLGGTPGEWMLSALLFYQTGLREKELLIFYPEEFKTNRVMLRKVGEGSISSSLGHRFLLKDNRVVSAFFPDGQTFQMSSFP